MSPDQGSSQTAAAAAGTSILIAMIFGLAVAVFMVIVYWKIFSKAGYSGALGLLMFIPIANIIVLCVLAFGNWPVLQELNLLRQRNGMAPGPQYPQSPYPPQQPSYSQQQPSYPQQPPSYPQY
jgi:uncharacterized membrane protein YhaH (DUF805 family)